MAENTKISWATHTLNWWTGCEAISPACQSCYAASWAKRAGRDFAERILTTEANRKQPLKWQRNAAAFLAEHGHRQRVFVNSLSDWADNQAPNEWRASLFATIRETPDLDYLLLTKRIGNALKMLPTDWGSGYANVWLGATIANQAEADRDIPKLLATPARVRFLSIEPMLSQIDLTPFLWGRAKPCASCTEDADCDCGFEPRIKLDDEPAIHWVISGGESGSKARPSHPDWFRSLRDDCAAAGVAYHHKQHGEFIEAHERTGEVYSDQAEYDQLAAECDGFISLQGHFVRSLEDAHEDTKYRGLKRVGKKAAGRTLDGVVHDAFPDVNR